MQIYLILTLSAFNSLGVQAARVMVALYALELGASPIMVGIVGATFSFFPVLLAVTAGRFTDKFGALWPLLCGACASSLGMFIPYLFPGLTSVFLAGALCGLSLVLFNVSTQNLVGVLSLPKERARNFSNYSLANSTTSFIGPMLAGYSIEHSGYAFTFLVLAALCAASIPLLVIWRGLFRAARPAPAQENPRFGEMLKSPGIPGTLVSSSLQDTGDILYQFYMPVYMHAIGLSASAIGVVLAMKAAAGFVMRIALPRLVHRFSEQRSLEYAFYLSTLAVIVVPFCRSVFTLASFSFIFGLGVGCAGPIVTMLMFAHAPQGRSGEALGMRLTVNHGTKLVAPILFGAVASGLGLSPVFWINAAMLAAGGFINHPKALKRSPHPAPTDRIT